MKIAALRIFLFSLLFLGCDSAREGARTIGRPIGATQKVLGGVSEGAREAYSDDDAQDNPYKR